MRKSWNEQKSLLLLEKWINEGRWKGTAHFRKHNTPLYEFIYRTMGMSKAFEKIGLNYSKFKKGHGEKARERSIEDITNDLHYLIKTNQWQGPTYLYGHNSKLHRELSRIGFQKAFKCIGLDYREYRHAIWDESNILSELQQVIQNKEWQGAYHLRVHHSSLYNAIVREIGFMEAFRKIGLKYGDYKLYR